jgi:RNA-directed DNA polymerase
LRATNIILPERVPTSGRSPIAREFVEPSKEDRQMAVMKMTGAASDQVIAWRSINWADAHQMVRRLQMRIAKAVREGRWGRVTALQRLLTHSLYGKTLP